MIKRLCLSLAVINILLAFGYPVQAAERKSITVTVQSSPEAAYQTSLVIREKRLTKRLLTASEISVRFPIPLSDVTLTIGNRRFLLDRKGMVYDLDQEKEVVLPESASKLLLRYAVRARKKHYGTLVPWEKVDEWLPRKSVFTVKDLETGKTFQVQRRAGSRHADVQPLTKEDTRKMKAIYDGKWSWRRRAILVKADGRRIAASMHGMPHGAGALANGFPGHFCIHFLGSSTHRSKKVDPTHEVMIYKAAGKIDAFLEKASAYEIMDAFFVGVNQKDQLLLRKILTRENEAELKKLLTILGSYDAMKPASPINDGNVLPIVGFEVPLQIRTYQEGRGETKRKLTFVLTRNAPGERWRIDTPSMLESFE